MKCLYCGEPLALTLLKRFTGGGEFCSDACKTNYQVEFTQLAVGRLQQARQVRRPGAAFALPNGLPETPAGSPVAVEEPPLPLPAAEPEIRAKANWSEPEPAPEPERAPEPVPVPEPEPVPVAPVAAEPPPPPLQGLAHPPEPLFFQAVNCESPGFALETGGPVTAAPDAPRLAAVISPEPFVYTPPPPPEPEPDLPRGGVR